MFLTVIYEAGIHRRMLEKKKKKKLKWNTHSEIRQTEYNNDMRCGKKEHMYVNVKLYITERETEWGGIGDNKWSVQQTDWMGSIGD